MRKYYYIFAVSALALCACSKEIDVPVPTEEPAVTVEEGKVLVTFSSKMPVPVEEGKTTLNTNGSVSWEDGDEIEVWYLDADNTPKHFTAAVSKVDGTDATKADFSGQIDEGDAPDHFWACYPKGTGELKYEEETESFSVTVAETDGSFKQANIMAAYTTADSKSFAFKNAVGIIRLQIPEGGVISNGGTDYTISKIRLKGKETSIRSRGTATVNVTSGAVSGFEYPSTTGTQSAQVALTDAVRATGYAYIASFPGTMTNGFAVRFFSDGGNIPAVLTKDTPVTITAGNVKPLSDLTPRIIWDYYVSATGSGDGLTAANPMSIDSMMDLLESDALKAGGANVIMCYANRINGATFHFTSGTHTISTPITIPAKTVYSEATYYTITGDNEATLDGGGSSRIFEITNACDRVTVSDITLTNGSASASGGLLLISSTSPLFKHCAFTNTETSANGGAVRVDTEKTGKGTFENCTFSGNKADKGGAFLITNAGTSASFKECTFTDNTATNYGGAIYSTNGTLEFDNCSFGASGHGNKANGGGAIYADGSGTFKLNKCDISYNEATSTGGGIYANNAKPVFYLNACTLIDNKTAANGYAIYLNSSATDSKEASLCVNNSYFYHSTTLNTKSKNQSVVCNKGKSIIMNSTLVGTFGSNAWGTFALGCHKNFSDSNGCLLINNIIKNKAAQYQTSAYETGGNYYAVFKHCLARVVHVSSTGYESQIVQDNVASDKDISLTGYTWSGTTPDGFAKKTAQEISDELLKTNGETAVYGLAAKFYSWLEGLKYTSGETQYNAFQVDINGTPRSGSYWPGCYQE